MAVFGTLAAYCLSFNRTSKLIPSGGRVTDSDNPKKASQPHRVAPTSTRAVESSKSVSPILDIALGTESRPGATEKGP